MRKLIRTEKRFYREFCVVNEVERLHSFFFALKTLNCKEMDTDGTE